MDSSYVDVIGPSCIFIGENNNKKYYFFGDNHDGFENSCPNNLHNPMIITGVMRKIIENSEKSRIDIYIEQERKTQSKHPNYRCYLDFSTIFLKETQEYSNMNIYCVDIRRYKNNNNIPYQYLIVKYKSEQNDNLSTK